MMNCYAPLFVNVNPGGRQWAVNLIGYDALSSFGSPSYYVQKMFSSNRGDVVLPANFDNVPKLTAQQIPIAPTPPPAAGAPPRGGGAGGARGPTGPFDGLYVSATRETSSGDVILKLVNVEENVQALQIDLQGVPMVKKDATGEVLTGALDAINTVTTPTSVVPKPMTIKNAGTNFAYELVRLKTR
jgi:alpha-N-arabinofuranosidase